MPPTYRSPHLKLQMYFNVTFTPTIWLIKRGAVCVETISLYINCYFKSVHNDIKLNVANDNITELTCIDLSAAFDSIPMKLLSRWLLISGTAWACFRHTAWIEANE